MVSNRRWKPKSKKPIRKRWIATALTMERLCALHEDNPAGIGLLSDEILSVLDGLNQYKGKGNDRQKLLMLWNGHSFDNPTAENIARYIFTKLSEEFSNKNVKVNSIKLWETDKSAVSYKE